MKAITFTVAIACLLVCSSAFAPRRIKVKDAPKEYVNVKYEVQPVYRWYLGSNGDHFYCLDPKGELAPSIGYNNEGIGFYTLKSQEPGTVPFYRLFSNEGGHLYTTDPSEQNKLVENSWSDEGNIGYVFTAQVPGSVAIHRYYPANFGKNFYTVNPAVETLKEWDHKGVIGYAFNQASSE